MDRQPHTSASYAVGLVSVVVPAFNESGNLSRLYADVAHVLDGAGLQWELVVADDGSSDQTWETVQALRQQDGRVKGVRLSRNFGHQYALLAGLTSASGEAVISMDADMQHPPGLLVHMVDAWREGYQVVNTVRRDPQNLPWFKRTTSRWYARVFSLLSGVPMDAGMADFRLLDRQVLDEILAFPEEGLFLRGIVQWVGYQSTTLFFDPGSRYAGRSKYTLWKMIRFAWHGVSAFSIVPLRLGVGAGLCISGLSFAAIVYAMWSKFVAGQVVEGWTSSIAIVSFFFGMLFVLLGLLGEYIGRILVEVRRRPRYLVRESLGLDGEASSSTRYARQRAPRLRAQG